MCVYMYIYIYMYICIHHIILYSITLHYHIVLLGHSCAYLSEGAAGTSRGRGLRR